MFATALFEEGFLLCIDTSVVASSSNVNFSRAFPHNGVNLKLCGLHMQFLFDVRLPASRGRLCVFTTVQLELSLSGIFHRRVGTVDGTHPFIVSDAIPYLSHHVGCWSTRFCVREQCARILTPSDFVGEV